jgi:Ca2+/Na+ antiporter
MDTNLMVTIGGSAIGLLGAAIGTYCAIKSTRTPAERRFVVMLCIGGWVVSILLIGLPLVLALAGIIQEWVYWVTFALFFILLVPTMRWANRRQTSFRKEIK